MDALLSDTKKVLEKTDVTLDELKDAKDSLQKSFEELGQEAMKNAGAGSAPMPGGGSEQSSAGDESASDDDSKKKEEDIVDADFEVVDEEKESKWILKEASSRASLTSNLNKPKTKGIWANQK